VNASLAAVASLPTPVALIVLGVLQFLTLAIALAAAFAAGAPVADRLAPRAGAERFALAVACGLGAWGTALFWLGLAGGLRRAVVFALAAFAVGSLAVGLRRRSALGRAVEGGGSRLAFAAVALALVPAFVGTLYPPTSFDVTAYHLPFARAFVAAGRLVATPDLVFEIFPQLAETLFAALLAATRSDLSPALVQLIAVGAIALLLFAAGERWFSRRAGLWAAALWLAHPLVHFQAASADVDAVQALFVLLAVFAWERWRDEAARARRAVAWLALAGAATGCGAATKYLGLFWVALLAAATLLARPAASGPGRIRATALFALAATLVAAPWYVRIWSATGNPIHPLFEGHAARADAPPDAMVSQWMSTFGQASMESLPAALGQRLVDVVRRPGQLARFAWRASFAPKRFDRQAPLAPWALVLTPLAALFAFRDARLRRWLLFVLGYALFWTTLQPRFQLSGAVLLALAGAGALERLASSVPRIGRLLDRRRAAALLALGFLAPGPAYALYKVAKHRAAPPTTPATREAFLDRELEGYAGLAWLERERGSGYTVFLLGPSNLTDFATGRVRGQARGRWRVGLVRPFLNRPPAFHRALRAMDCDYLLVGRSHRPRPRVDEAFRALFRRVEGDARHDLYELLPAQEPPSRSAFR